MEAHRTRRSSLVNYAASQGVLRVVPHNLSSQIHLAVTDGLQEQHFDLDLLESLLISTY
jgi:hypothetical protein